MFNRNFLQIPKRKFFTSQVAFSSEHLFDRVNCLSMKRSSQLKNRPCLWPRFARDLRVEKITMNTLLMRPFSTVNNEHVLACVRGYLKKIGSGHMYRFDENGCVGHVAMQYFPYQPRLPEEAAVCAIMHTRWQDRINGPIDAAIDKSINPLISIPGSPGSGKSAFLANFPNSKCYKQLLKNRHPESIDIQPIVALYSFPPIFSEDPEVGLRILHGALASMGVWGEQSKIYGVFYKELFGSNNMNADSITVKEALEILWEFFGKHRPILLLQDETSRIRDDNKVHVVLANVCEAMSDLQSVDLVVSALSPTYVHELVTEKSQRQIKYVVLGPLPNEHKIMAARTMKWAKFVRNRYEKDTKRKMDEMVFKLLTGAYLMASHHPRSVERLGKWFKDCIDQKREVFTVAELANTNNFFKAMSKKAVNIMPSRMNDELTPELLFYVNKFGLSKDAVIPEKQPQFRYYLENGQLFIAGEIPEMQAFYTAIRAADIFKLWDNINDQYRNTTVSSDYRNVADFQAIFCTNDENFNDTHKIATLFEKCVTMSVLFSIRKAENTMLSTEFGCKQFMLQGKFARPKDISLFIENPDILKNPELMGDKEFLLVPPPGQRGFDALFRLRKYGEKDPLYVYMQMKVAPRTNKDLLMELVLAIKNIIYTHSHTFAKIDSGVSSGGTNPNKAVLEQMYVIFYDAGNQKKSIVLNYKKMQVVAQEQLTRAVEQGLKAQSPEAYLPVVLEFLQHHQDQLQVVTQPQLRDFLIPSFVPLMDLANHVQK